jgi:Leucine-rich repeat (LRR) protein
MKAFIILFIVLPFYGYSQFVEIKDINFKRSLIREKINQNKDGEISVQEALAVTKLNLFNNYLGYTSKMWIKNLEGIEYFKSLEYLNVSGNNLSDADLKFYKYTFKFKQARLQRQCIFKI